MEYQSLSDLKQAIIYHNQHLSIAKELEDRAGEGSAYGNLGNVFQCLGDSKQAIKYHMQYLSIAKELGDRASEGGAYGNLGIAYQSLSDFKQAITYHNRHLSIAKELRDRAGEGGAYSNLGNAYQRLRDYKQAIMYHNQHLSIAKELGDRAGEGRAYGSLGIAYQSLGDFKQAIMYHNQNLSIAKELGDRAGEGGAYGNLGIAYWSLGDFKQAIECHMRTLSIAKELGDRTREGRAYGHLGNVNQRLGDFEQAKDYYMRFLSIVKELGDRDGEGRAYGNLGNTYQSLGDFEQAKEYHMRYLSMVKELGDRAAEGGAYGNLGITCQSLGDFEQAKDYQMRCLSIVKELGDRRGEGLAYVKLGNTYQSLGDFEQAKENYMRYLSIVKELGDRDGEGRAYGNLGNTYQSLGDFEQAKEYHMRYLSMVKELGDRAGEGRAYGNIGDAYQSLGDFKQAIEYHIQSRTITKEPGETAGGQQPLLSVPPEVLMRGPEAMEAYTNALVEGKSLVKRLPLMLIGQHQAGKTSLKKSLKGICFNPEEESTVGIDADPSHFKLSNEIWKAGEKDQESNAEMAISFEHQTARLIADRLKKKENDSDKKRASVAIGKRYDPVSFETAIPVIPTMREARLTEPSKDPEQIQSSEDPGDWTSVDNTAFTPPGQDFAFTPAPDQEFAFTPPDQEFEEIAALAETLLQNDELENGDVYSILWDFAGQSVYYVTHVLFLTARAIYFLVYDLSQNPNDRAKPLMKQGVYKKLADKSNLKTNLDYLDFWMTSLASQASQHEDAIDPKSEMLPKKLPAVFLVCTHADKPHGGGNAHELASEIFGFLKNKPYGAHLYDVFCVDNTKSGSVSECPGVMRLREEVLAVSKKLPYINEAIPIKWLKYEKALQMVLESEYKWISLDKAKYIASKVCKINGDDEIMTLINFLHDLRILIHFDDSPELNNLVVLDPQWLIDVFKKVITVRPYLEEKTFVDLWCKLEGEGILHEDLVKHVWSDLNHYRETFEGLIAIMEKFGLLCTWNSSDGSSSKQYLVPSMLKSHPPEALMKLAASAQVPSLFVKFESGQVPSGLFPRLLLEFLQWGKEKVWRPGNPKLYHNFARFFMSGDEGCSVILQCHSSSIEVLYHNVRDNAAGFDCTRAVCRQIGLILECMRNQFRWLNNMRYHMSVICPVCCKESAVVQCDSHDVEGCKQEECLHFWSESELCGSKRSIICTKSAFAEDITVDPKVWTPWFASPVEQVANGKHDGTLLSSYEANEENTLALLGGNEVLESILSEPCDSKEVVSRLSENLEQLSLTDPDPDTKKLVRCLAKKAKCSNRIDVVEHLREITPAGTTGPLLNENLEVQRIPFDRGRKLTISLSGRDEWKLVAEKLGLTPEEILFLDKRTRNPAEAMLGHITQRLSVTVGELYDLLNDCELPVMADIL